MRHVQARGARHVLSLSHLAKPSASWQHTKDKGGVALAMGTFNFLKILPVGCTSAKAALTALDATSYLGSCSGIETKLAVVAGSVLLLPRYACTQRVTATLHVGLLAAVRHPQDMLAAPVGHQFATYQGGATHCQSMARRKQRVET